MPFVLTRSTVLAYHHLYMRVVALSISAIMISQTVAQPTSVHVLCVRTVIAPKPDRQLSVEPRDPLAMASDRYSLVVWQVIRCRSQRPPNASFPKRAMLSILPFA